MGITRQQALDCFASDDLIGIGMEADAVRRRLHPEGVVSYIIDRNINYTNFCTEYCTFCAFYRPLKGKLAAEGYILEFDTIYDKIRETLEMGGTGVLMQGGIHPDLKIDWFESLFTGIKQRFPSIWLHCLSASEILAIAEYSELSLRDTIARLRDAGLDSIPGGGAEILDDEVRKRIARLKCRTEDWVSVHRTAHALGMSANSRKKPEASPPSSPGVSSPTTPLWAVAAGMKLPQLSTSRPWLSAACTSTTSRMCRVHGLHKV